MNDKDRFPSEGARDMTGKDMLILAGVFVAFFTFVIVTSALGWVW
jgi:hypothetical protein